MLNHEYESHHGTLNRAGQIILVSACHVLLDFLSVAQTTELAASLPRFYDRFSTTIHQLIASHNRSVRVSRQNALDTGNLEVALRYAFGWNCIGGGIDIVFECHSES